MTRAQRTVLPLSADVAQVLAEQHGVCVRPIAMRRIDTTTGRIDVIPVPCGSIRDDHCRPCADKARRLRMVQCRQGWHLDTEPIIHRARPTPAQQELMAARADLFAAYARCKANSDEVSCEQIADSVTDLDDKLRASGIRGRLTPLDPPPKPVKRSTRRRQDAPDLPRRRATGRCKGKAHQLEHLGIAGRRVLVSRKWSNKSLDDHRAERGQFVRQLLEAAGIQPAHAVQDGPYRWERLAPNDPNIPPRPVLLLHAIAERQRWKAEYTAAQLAANRPPDNDRSATSDQAA
jgi:hypothetical protein